MAEQDEPVNQPVNASHGEASSTPDTPPAKGQAAKDQGAELARRRADLDRQEQRLADLERLLAARLAELEGRTSAMPASVEPTGDTVPASSPSGPTLSARLRAHKRALSEVPPAVPVRSERTASPPSDAPPVAATASNQVTDQPPSPSVTAAPEGQDERERRSRWLLLPPVLAILVLAALILVLLRPQGQALAPATLKSPGTATNVVSNATTLAEPTATVTVQTSTANIAATGLAPATVTAVLAAASVLILQSTATAVPTAMPRVVPTTLPSAVPTTAPAMALLVRVATAEAALRSGQIVAAIDSGSGTYASATLVFDLGNSTQPRLHLTTTYASTVGTQSSEQVTIGDLGWQRQANSQWTAAAPQGVFESVQPYLPHGAAVTQATLGGGGSTLMWYDASRSVDVTLSVDPATGVPRTLQEVARGGGARRTITYSAWNTPVDIRPPPSP